MKLVGSDYLSLFLAALLLVGTLTPAFRRFAILKGVLDKPTEKHKTHLEATPYLGGVAIMIGVIILVNLAILIKYESASYLGLANSVLIPAFLLGIMGLVDDLRKLNPWPRFIMQNVAAISISLLLVNSKTFGSPTGSKIIDLLISIVWLVGITNSINFFDNFDGGASITVLISSATLAFLSWNSNQFLLSALAITICGAVSGFLKWNKPPARIYMGDAGSLFLGMLLASLSIRLDPSPINKWASLSVPLFLLAVPCIDTSVAVFSRIRRGISPFQGGKDHLSHRLTRSGFSKKQTLAVLGILTAGFSGIACALSFAPYSWEGMISAVGIILMLLTFFFFIRTSDI